MVKVLRIFSLLLLIAIVTMILYYMPIWQAVTVLMLICVYVPANARSKMHTSNIKTQLWNLWGAIKFDWNRPVGKMDAVQELAVNTVLSMLEARRKAYEESQNAKADSISDKDDAKPTGEPTGEPIDDKTKIDLDTAKEERGFGMSVE